MLTRTCLGGAWLRGLDLNQRPLGYEPNELPDCSTPHLYVNNRGAQGQTAEWAAVRRLRSAILPTQALHFLALVSRDFQLQRVE